LLSITALLIISALGMSIVLFQLLTGVPPLSSNMHEAMDVVSLLKKADLADGSVIYELGSGWGSLALTLARAFPAAQVRGIEISPLPYWVSRFRTRRMPNVKLYRGDFFDRDLGDANAVTCFLMGKSMPKLAALLDRSLGPDTPVVSLCFWFRDRKVAASLTGAGPLGAAALYYWPAHRQID
ncbi:MAG TPA: class I SAM-dependent methyltransferase, partial [Rhodocyclaceae bacterium]|nr:class I SAM-dependent methyltransferase [Rhodocyclaceae bacterium]